jgi:hypothetical protein
MSYICVLSPFIDYAKLDADLLQSPVWNGNIYLETSELKDILIDSLRYLSNEKPINVFAFVIMNNHIQCPILL